MNQTQILKKLSGYDRLTQAFMLSDFVRELAITNIKQIHPNISKKQLFLRISEGFRYD